MDELSPLSDPARNPAPAAPPQEPSTPERKRSGWFVVWLIGVLILSEFQRTAVMLTHVTTDEVHAWYVCGVLTIVFAFALRKWPRWSFLWMLVILVINIGGLYFVGCTVFQCLAELAIMAALFLLVITGKLNIR